MRISLSSPVRKAAFLGGGALLLLLYFGLCFQALVAYWVARTPTIEGFARAATIDPLDSYYPRALGLYYLDQDQTKATGFFEQALRRDPHSARLWLELATAYSLVRQPEKQRSAVMNALADSPKDVTVEWEAANLLLLGGDNPAGFRLMSDVAAVDPARRESAVQTVFRHAGGDVFRTLGYLPATTDVRQALFKSLLRDRKYSQADQVWPFLMSTSGTVDRQVAFSYLDSLISRREVSQASAAWQSLTRQDAEIRRHAPSDGLVANGDFEAPLLNAGLEWRKHLLDGFTLSQQYSVFHGGNSALELEINSDSVQDGGLFQLVPVDPNSHYQLSAFLRAEELESANGIRLAVSDYYTGSTLMLGEELVGSFPWRQTTEEFTTGPDTQLLKLSFGRSPDIGRIRGRLWIDDVRLEKR
jgi:tetratricopeptide (TPR) repeat protein